MELVENNETTLVLSEQINGLVTSYLKEAGSAKVTNLYEFVLEQIEPPVLETVMIHCHHNQSRASQVLDIAPSTLRKKLIQYFEGRYCGKREKKTT